MIGTFFSLSIDVRSRGFAGGTTYCSIAALEMFNRTMREPSAPSPTGAKVDDVLRSQARRWLVQRQISPIYVLDNPIQAQSNESDGGETRHDEEHIDDDDDLALELGIGGFQGRPGKLADVCYSFWCGAALKVRVAALSL